ncbi:MAG: hypothetical protein GQE15_06850 [Archangiaceae bacterium]|nr:hypothetical protein [Archangiaceae bacterium]
MLRRVALALVLATAASAEPPTARQPATATSEATRLGAEYFIQKAGATWTYQLQSGSKGRVSINSFVEWKAGFSYSIGKKSVSGTWRVKEGNWLERSSARADGEVVLLPAVMTRGTRWQAPASIEKGTKETSQYEVLALDAQVDLPNGIVIDHCLAVLETGLDGSAPYTHYYAPNLGKVGVRGPDDWLFRLVEFRPGSRGHSE